MDRALALTEMLLDETEDPCTRDDAATDLADVIDPRVVQPLFLIASNPNTDIVLAETAAESLAEVWSGLGYYDKEAVKKMPTYSQNEIIGIFSARKPEWHKELVAYLNWQDK